MKFSKSTHCKLVNEKMLYVIKKYVVSSLFFQEKILNRSDYQSVYLV